MGLARRLGPALLLAASGCSGSAISSNPGESAGSSGDESCTLTHQGDLTVETAAELAALRGYRLVEFTDTSPFSGVRVVTGSVLIHGNTVLERVTPPELQEIGERLEIANNPVLTELELPALRSATGILISANATLSSCGVEAFLSTVAGAATSCGDAPDDCAVECPPRP